MDFTLTVFMIIFCCLPSLVFAQPDGGGDPDVVPIDGGLAFLAAVGLAYSVKKIKRLSKQNNQRAYS